MMGHKKILDILFVITNPLNCLASKFNLILKTTIK